MPNDSYNCTLGVQLSATQTIALNAQGSPRPQIPYSNFNFGPVTYSAARAANPITLAIYHKYEAIGTSGIEIDLTDLPDINGGTKDATGKQLFLISVTVKTAGKKLMIKNAATNSYPVAVDNVTANLSSTVAATLVKSQVGNSTQPAMLTLSIPATANAGYIKLNSPFNYPALITYDPSTNDVSAAIVTSLSGGGTVSPATQWVVTEPTSGTFVATYQFNADVTTPSIVTQGLLNIASSEVVTSLPAYPLHPTLIVLGLNGAVVDSTHKKIKLAAVADTLDAEVTLWFIDAVT